MRNRREFVIAGTAVGLAAITGIGVALPGLCGPDADAFPPEDVLRWMSAIVLHCEDDPDWIPQAHAVMGPMLRAGFAVGARHGYGFVTTPDGIRPPIPEAMIDAYSPTDRKFTAARRQAYLSAHREVIGMALTAAEEKGFYYRRKAAG